MEIPAAELRFKVGALDTKSDGAESWIAANASHCLYSKSVLKCMSPEAVTVQQSFALALFRFSLLLSPSFCCYPLGLRCYLASSPKSSWPTSELGLSTCTSSKLFCYSRLTLISSFESIFIPFSSFKAVFLQFTT